VFDLQGRYGVVSQDVVHEDFEGECVMLNLASGTYYALSKTASQLVTHLLNGIAVEELSSLSGPAFQAGEVQTFLAKLVDLELVAPIIDMPATKLADSVREEARSWPDCPTIEVYDDLADLILADPIHDTDESVGWPAVAKANRKIA